MSLERSKPEPPTRFEAFRYAIPGQKADYYDSDGRSMRRFFLKSPLKFEPRVTSSFSGARRHPVLNYTRAHNGVDYAAPPGAPGAPPALHVPPTRCRYWHRRYESRSKRPRRSSALQIWTADNSGKMRPEIGDLFGGGGAVNRAPAP